MACETWRVKISAYVDGELSASDTNEVRAHVRQCGDCAAVALDTVRIKRMVASAGNPHTPSPELRAKITKMVASPQRARLPWWRMILAPVALLAVVALGLNLYLAANRARDRVYGELADLHVAALASATPVDVISTDRHTVKPWFEGKLPFSFNLPELHGTEFELLGGRVTYFEQSPGAHLIYKLRKHELSVFIVQERGGTAALTSAPVEKLSFHIKSWTKNGLRYYVIGDVGADDIQNLSRLLRDAG
jgi:anti-sigma factor RsiW